MKGIILSGGLGTRLHPITYAISKQLLPVFNKPMIYYSLSTLMMAKIREILFITTAEDLKNYKKLFGDGSRLGMKITYAIQKKPRGLVDAFHIGAKFIGRDDVCLILGDNIFYGDDFSNLLIKSKKIVQSKKKAIIFTYQVKKPSDYGIANIVNNKLVSLVEKPKNTNSNNAVVGLYFYPNSVIQLAKKIKPSKRRELEITDLNKIYLKLKKIEVIQMGRGYAWFDAGSIDSLLEVSQFIKSIENRMGYKIGCIEEISLKNNWITKKKLKIIAKKYYNSEYGLYVKSLTK
ncbi:glucose-1-phosphate thymidylyltransferase RfbA [Candidatus Pelagibacter ubique]|nr:glucose-1-phosphate thymidylyltransferase RfbA [Candidatus Pelagibacter ubique]